ncbi:MAG TPA: FtsX-like permease family protein [Rhodothermales bacterium]
MRFERYMAARYLRDIGRGEGRRFLRFVMYVAVGGVAVGVAALLLSLSIVRGFSSEIREKIVGFGAHVQVESYQDAPLTDAGERLRVILEQPHVVDVAPVIQQFVLLRRAERDVDGVILWGTDAVPPYLETQLVAGSVDLTTDSLGRPGLVVGQKLADLLGLEVGDLATAFSMRNSEPDGGLSASRPRVKQFRITGVYETDLHNFDELFVFAGSRATRDFLEVADDAVTRFDVTLDDPAYAQTVALALEDELGFPVMARTIFEVYHGLFAWIRLQESIIPVVISVIVIVAAFNIMGTLLMIILEKTREMGVLASLGSSRRSIRRLFLWLGVLIGVSGTLIGEVTALVLALIQQRFKVIPLPAEAYYMNTAPIELYAPDFVLVAVVALVLCALSAYVPARVASAIDPVRAIRFR